MKVMFLPEVVDYFLDMADALWERIIRLKTERSYLLIVYLTT